MTGDCSGTTQIYGLLGQCQKTIRFSPTRTRNSHGSETCRNTSEGRKKKEEHMARVLVTGAGGYIGTVLVPTLLEQGYKVRALDRFFFGRDLLAADPRIEIVQEDARKIRPEHLAGIEAVVDLAALSNDPSGELFQKETWEINCDARVRTAKLAKESGVKRYILPSSCSVYGFQANGHTVCENSEVNPRTTYAKANRGAEEGILPVG